MLAVVLRRARLPVLPVPVADHTRLSILQDATIVWSLGLLIVSLWQIHGWFAVRNLVRRSHPAEPAQAEVLQRLCDRLHPVRFAVAMRVMRSTRHSRLLIAALAAPRHPGSAGGAV